MVLSFIFLLTVQSIAFLVIIDARCPNWCNNRGDCISDENGGFCLCEMGLTGEDCSLKLCPAGFDPINPMPIFDNTHRRTIRLASSLQSGVMVGSIELTFSGSSVLLPADASQLSSQQCTFLLSGLRSVADITCVRDTYDGQTKTGQFTITLDRFPTKPYMNNVIYHNGNPSLDLFSCNTSRVNEFEAVGVYCEISDMVVDRLPCECLVLFYLSYTV